MITRLEVVQKVINTIGAKTYLEIGVRYGTVFLNVKASRKIAIDPNFKIPLWKKLFFVKDFLKNQYFPKTSNDFFTTDSIIFEKGKIDVAFIDGLHTHEQSLIDVENCLKFLNRNGVIILHDCNPISPSMGEPSFEKFQKMPDEGKAWSGDVWKTICYVRSIYPDLYTFVLDTDCGLGVITLGKQENRLFYTADEIKNMEYTDLEKNRKEILNLKNPEYLDEFLAKLS